MLDSTLKTHAWAKSLNAEDKVTILADGEKSFFFPVVREVFRAGDCEGSADGGAPERGSPYALCRSNFIDPTVNPFHPHPYKHAHVAPRGLRGGQGAGADGRDGRLWRPPHVPLQRPGAVFSFKCRR